MKKKILFSLFVLLIVHFIFHIEDCEGQWVQKSNGITGTGVISIVSDGLCLNVGTGSGGIFYSTNNGDSWMLGSNLSQFSINSLIVNGQDLFAGVGLQSLATGGGVYSSPIQLFVWSNLIPNLNISSLAAYGNNIFAANEKTTNPTGVYVSTNNGNTWSQTSLNNVSIGALAVIGNKIFAGQRGTTGGAVYWSTNNGVNWTATSFGNKNIKCFAVNGNTIYAGTAASGDGVYISTDAGLSWSHTSLYTETYSLVTYGNYVFAGTASNGIYMSSNNGINWIQKNQGFPINSIVYSLYVSGSYIYAGTYDYLLWRCPLSLITGSEHSNNVLPVSFSLSQNYPNPFNPVTIIKYMIAENGKQKTENGVVVLKIYDILGKEVETLVNEKQAPGTYEVSWDARHGGSSSYPSGVYYYKITAGDYSETKKMILVK